MRAVVGCVRRRWRWLLVCPPLVIVLLNWRLLRLLDVGSAGGDQEATTLSPAASELRDFLRERLSAGGGRAGNASAAWAGAKEWDRRKHAYPLDKSVGRLLAAMQTARVVRAECSSKGTQLKLVLTLEGNESVYFKPQWYRRDEIIRGHVYSGKDRHNAEVVAFYLSAVLDVRWAPPAALRRLNLQRDVWDTAGADLQDAMFQKEDGTLCLFGKCHYCRRNESVCGDARNEIEGAVIHTIGGRFDKYRSPWQRTYNLKKQAEWERNPDYCNDVKKALPPNRLLDLIDVAVFDYLLQNGDRHHYETIGDRIVYFDNGKGLGNPHKDFNDILAPLYQCCVIRQSTWKRLKMLSGGYLSTILSDLLASSSREDAIPVVDESHLQAMDRRLLTVYSVINACIGTHGKSIFKNL